MSNDSTTSGKSQHAFMAEALSAQARRVDQRRDLLRAAFAAEDEALESGRAYPSAAVDAYFDARASERPSPLPERRPWRK